MTINHNFRLPTSPHTALRCTGVFREGQSLIKTAVFDAKNSVYTILSCIYGYVAPHYCDVPVTMWLDLKTVHVVGRLTYNTSSYDVECCDFYMSNFEFLHFYKPQISGIYINHI